jgi:hypothetical protein
MALEITFTGLEARRHKIEANDGLESLAGLAHAATLVAHFVAEGRVRQRQPYNDRLRFFFEKTQPGSLTAVLVLGGALATGVMSNGVYELLKFVLKRATGTDPNEDTRTGDTPRSVGGLIEVGGYFHRPGDLDALTEAVTPSILRGHAWIGHPDQKISIRTGRKIFVELNEKTKSHLKDEIIEEGESTQDVSVAALNANSRYGRVYFYDLGRTIPFRVDKHATARTTSNLSRYLTQYVDNTGSDSEYTVQKGASC